MKTSALVSWSLCVAVVSALATCASCGDFIGVQDEQISVAVFEDDNDPALAALPIVETELLVQSYPGAHPSALTDLYASVGAQAVDKQGEIQLTTLQLPAAELETAATSLADSGLIEAIHRNYIFQAQETPDDPMFVRQQYLGQVGAPDAWEVTVGDEEVIVAVIDSGVDTEHPDLTDKILDGWNVYDENADFRDVQGHGTQVAGIMAAASDNAVGVTGLSWESPIIAVRVTNGAGQTTGRHIAAGILWAVGQGAKVINVSFAPLWSNTVIRSAVEQAYNRGALVVISSGNGGGQRSARGYAEALFVGAVDASDTIASFSDRGPFVDLVAPGTGIRSTTLGSGYGLANGTSFAAPIVAGVAALAWSVNPDLRPVSIVSTLTDSAVDLGRRGKDSTYGYGIVDALGAVEAAAAESFAPDDTPPELVIDSPRSRQTFSGRFVASVSPSDDWGVADVVMFVDGLAFATDTRASYKFVIDPAAFEPGTHELGFVATDWAGNSSGRESVNVRFRSSSSNDTDVPQPGIVFISPSPGSRVSGDVTIDATVTASEELATAEWLVDGESVFVTSLSGRTSALSYVWRTGDVSRGSHTIALIVTDQSGNRGTAELDLTKR